MKPNELENKLPTREHMIAYLLGAFRDGSIHKYGASREIIVWQKNPVWLEGISYLIRQVFEIKTMPKKTIGGWRLKFKSKQVFEMLVKDFGFPQSGKQIYWKTPSAVLEGAIPKESYLSGFFDAEGSAQIKPPALHFFQSWNLENICPPLEDLKNMMQELRIDAGKVRLRKPTIYANYPRFILSVSNKRSVINFYQQIGSLHPDKGKNLQLAASNGQGTEAPIL